MSSAAKKTNSRAKLLSHASAIAIVGQLAVNPVLANPLGGEVVAGAVTIQGQGASEVTITQESPRAIVNWDSFSIGEDERTTIHQPGADAILANRVVGADPSEILGSLSANGRVVLINRNGILFGEDAVVDVGGLVATTHDIDDDAFMAGGDVRFEDGGVTEASVVNEGAITVKDAGIAAFVAPHVRNEGVITARLGRVALGAGTGFTLDLYGDGLIKFEAGDEISETLMDASGAPRTALVENEGDISAAGGKVLLTAAAAREVVNQSVNISGVVRAESVHNVNGVITLSGSGEVRVEADAIVSAAGENAGRIDVEANTFLTNGLVTVDAIDSDEEPAGTGGVIAIAADAAALGGKLSASGKIGGTISVETAGQLSLGERVEAIGALGAGGTISYKADRIVENSTGVTNAQGLTHGGRILVDGGRQIVTSGRYAADGVYGEGGRIDVTAGDVRLLTAGFSASGRSQGGHVRIGGGFQGGKTPDPTKPYYETFLGRWEDIAPVANANQTFFGDSSFVDVSSEVGRGGTTVVWSNHLTTFLGAIDARGGLGGGSVEISSAEDLRKAELDQILVGASGQLLLDPKNITIGQKQTISDWAYAGIMGASYSPVAQNRDPAPVRGGDELGHAIALNGAGDLMAVGAKFEDGVDDSAFHAGMVQLYSFSDTKFSGGVLEAVIGHGYTGGKNIDLSSVLEASDYFGASVALNDAGDRLAVGAHSDDGHQNTVASAGAVHLFTFTDTNFSGGAHVGTLGSGYTGGKNVNVSLETGDLFGYAVSFNDTGDRLAVGARNDDGAGNIADTSGSVLLFSFADTSFSGGNLEGTVGRGYSSGKNVDVTNLGVTGDLFGGAVSLNAAGNRLAVGAISDDASNDGTGSAGAVYLISFTDTDFSGGNVEAIFGKGYSGGKNFNMSGLKISNNFGSGVALNAAGDLLAIGAYGDPSQASGSDRYGAVHLFSFTDTNFSGAVEEAKIGKGYTGGKNIDVSLRIGQYFGYSVAMNAAGDGLAVGAIGDKGPENKSANGRTGAVYLYTFGSDFTNGAHRATIGAGYADGDVSVSSLDYQDKFGSAVSFNGDETLLAVGAFQDAGANDLNDSAGAVYLFSFGGEGYRRGTLEGVIGLGYTGGKNVNVAGLGAGENFGRAVSLNQSGDRLAVGAFGDRGVADGMEQFGAVFLFSFTDTSFGGGNLEATLGKGYTGGKNFDVTTLDAYDAFGGAVALNGAGDRLVVGATSDDGAGNAVQNVGAVYLFSFTDTSFSGVTHTATIGKGYTGGKNLDVTALEEMDQAGYSVALNTAGDRLAVGVYNDYGSGNSLIGAGAVYLFSFTDTSYTGGVLEATLGKGYAGGKNVDLTALDSNDAFGASVSLNGAGDRLAVGAVNESGLYNALSNSGAVYLFTFSDTAFTGGAIAARIGAGYSGVNDVEMSMLDQYDEFGFSVELNTAGDRLVVGSPSDSGMGDKAEQTGAIYLFSFTDTSFSGGALTGTVGANYVSIKSYNVSAIDANDSFGHAVALNAIGDRLAVGAVDDDGFNNAVNGSGAVYLFSFTDTSFSGATLEATLGKGYTGGKNFDVAGLEYPDKFGSAVSLNATGDRLAVGASNDNGFNNAVTNSGAVYLFSFTDTNFSGAALEATIGNGYSVGKNLSLAALEASDQFGYSVSLNGVGDRLAVGVEGDDGAGDTVNEAGAVYLFSFTDAAFNGAVLEATIGAGHAGGKNFDVTSLDVGDHFGSAVSLNNAGDRLAVGVPLDKGVSDGHASAGAVYLFSFTDSSFSGATLEATLGKGYTGGKNYNVPGLETSDYFGASVSFDDDGDYLAVGAMFDDGANNVFGNSGAVHIFTFTDTNYTGAALHATIGKGYAGDNDLDFSQLNGSPWFGSGLSLNDAADLLAVGGLGAPSAAGGTTSYGAVYLFSRELTVAANDPLSDGAGFGSRSADSVYLAPADIVSQLSGGVSVTLQASNDITVDQDVLVTGSPASVGALTLQAGRSILVNNNVSTTANNVGGDINFVANETTANGVVDGERDAGAAVITLASGATIDAGPANVSFTLADGAGKTNTDSGDITLGSITANTISIMNNGPTSGSGVVLDAGAVLTANATSGTTIEIAGDGFTNNAGAGAFVTSTAGGETARWLVWSSDPLADDRGGLTYDFKQYNATHGTTPVAGDPDKNGVLYTLAPSLTPGLTGSASRVYDATTNALPALAAGNYVVSGAVDGDTVTVAPTAATFANKNVGANKTVNATGFAVASAANGAASVFGYQMASTSASGAIGEVTAAEVTVSGSFTADDKTYDATTGAAVSDVSGLSLAGVIAGDTVTLQTGTAASFADKNVGAGKTVSLTDNMLSGADKDNYTIAAGAPTSTADISAATLTVGGVTASNKDYDANTTAAITGAATLTGVLSGDTVAIGGTPTASFADKNVGTGKSVTVSGYTISGADSSNYSLVQPTGLTADISAVTVTITGTFTAANKTYDATTDATVSDVSGLSLAGVLAGDTVTLQAGNAASFDNKNIGTGKTVTLSAGLLTGADAGNYVLAVGAPTATANISAASLTISGLTADDRPYNATTTAGLTGTATLSGVVSGDTVVLGGTPSAVFDNKNIGAGKAVTVSGYTISGADSGNYTLAQPTGLTADISAASLTISGLTANDRTYNATTTADLTGTATLAGVVSGDTVVLGGTPSAVFDNKNIGAGKAVTVSGYTISGADSGNYTLAQPTGLTADISAASLTISGLTANDRTYNATTTADLTGTATLAGVVSGDTVVLGGTPSAVFDNKNIGAGKAVTVSGYTISGADSSNYTLAQPTGLTADISAASLTITGTFVASDKVYDATNNATVSNVSGLNLVGVLASDSVTLQPGAVASFSDKDVGVGKTVTLSSGLIGGADAANYVLAGGAPTATADITAATLTISGMTVNSRTYDTTTVANWTGGALSGVLAADVVSLDQSGASVSFVDKHVGADKAVSVSGFALSGAGASNYTLSQPTGLTAEISAATVTVSGTFVADDKVYDGTVNAAVSDVTGLSLDGVLGGDVVTLQTGAAASFDNKNIGQGKTVTLSGGVLGGADGGNYILAGGIPTATADISAAALTIDGLSIESKVYDTTTAATLAGTAGLAGVFSGDTVALDANTATASFADKNVGVEKSVIVSGYGISGADAANYMLTQPTGLTGDITPAPVTITGTFATETKVYDATTDAIVENVSGLSLAGVLGGDVVTLQAGTAAKFADKNVGQGKTVTLSSGLLAGADAENYALASGAPTAIADITPATLTIESLSVNDKAYDATTSANLTGGALSGVLGSDTVVLDVVSASASFSDKNVGGGKTVNVSGLSISGADAANYTFSANDASTTASISAATLTISSLEVDNKIYDATTGAIVADGALSGVIGADSVSLDTAGAAASFADKNVGAGKSVSVSGLGLSGADAGNYVLAAGASTTTASISAATLTVANLTASDKTYDATTTAVLTGGTLSGVLAADVVSLDTAGAAANFVDKNVGAGKTVSVSGLSVIGADSGNYMLAEVALTTTADITPASLTVSGLTINDKTYDGEADATWSGAALAGVHGGDSVTLDQANASAAFADKNVGAGKRVVASGFALSGADISNYTLVQPSELMADITAATLTVNVNDASRNANEPDPDITYTISGFAQNEDESVVSGLQLATNAVATSPPGEYRVYAEGASATNYRFEYIDGVLTVIANPATVNDVTNQVALADPTGGGGNTGAPGSAPGGGFGGNSGPLSGPGGGTGTSTPNSGIPSTGSNPTPGGGGGTGGPSTSISPNSNTPSVPGTGLGGAPGGTGGGSGSTLHLLTNGPGAGGSPSGGSTTPSSSGGQSGGFASLPGSGGGGTPSVQDVLNGSTGTPSSPGFKVATGGGSVGAPGGGSTTPSSFGGQSGGFASLPGSGGGGTPSVQDVLNGSTGTPSSPGFKVATGGGPGGSPSGGLTTPSSFGGQSGGFASLPGSSGGGTLWGGFAALPGSSGAGANGAGAPSVLDVLNGPTNAPLAGGFKVASGDVSIAGGGSTRPSTMTFLASGGNSTSGSGAAVASFASANAGAVLQSPGKENLSSDGAGGPDAQGASSGGAVLVTNANTTRDVRPVTNESGFVFEIAETSVGARSARDVSAGQDSDVGYWTAHETDDDEFKFAQVKPKVNIGLSEGVYYVGYGD